MKDILLKLRSPAALKGARKNTFNTRIPNSTQVKPKNPKNPKLRPIGGNRFYSKNPLNL
jgi:hypothetical protein